MSNGKKYPIILAHGIARFDFLLNFFSKTFDALGLNVDSPNNAFSMSKQGSRRRLNSVVYRAYAASQKQKLVFTPSQKSWDIINDNEGDNDGLVPVTSQLWQSQVVTSQGTVKHVEHWSCGIVDFFFVSVV